MTDPDLTASEQPRKAARTPVRRATRRSTAQPHNGRRQASEARQEARLRARMITTVQRMIDDPAPRHAELKAAYLAELSLAVSQAERRLLTLIESEAKRRRGSFRPIRGGRHD